jgi:hypothetical protein
MVQKRARVFTRRRTKGRPSYSRIEELAEVIQNCLADEQNLSVRLLEEITGINRETVRKILLEDLKKKKVCAHFVPHLLRPDQQHECAASSVEFVKMTDDDKSRIVAGDHSWCFLDDPEKSQSAIWFSPKKPKTQRVRMQKSLVKTMLTAFIILMVSFIINLCQKTDCKR